MSTTGQLGIVSHSTQKGFQSQKDCLRWKQGTCKFGSKCKFRHDPASKGKLQESQRNAGNIDGGATVSEPVPAPSTTTDGSELSAPTRVNVRRNVTGPERHRGGVQNPSKSLVMCRDWRAGKCLWGERCRYRHAGPEVAISSAGDPAGMINNRIQRIVGNRLEPKANSIIEKANVGLEAEAEGEAEVVRKDTERQEIHSMQTRRQAVDKAKIAHEKREREKILKLERARKAEEERQKREAEKAAREKEAVEAKKRRQAQLEKHAAVVEQYMVQDSSLVTFGAGLHIRNVVTGFDLCKVTIRNLPWDVRRPEIVDLFTQQGIDRSEFVISQMIPSGNKMEAIVLADTQYGQTVTLGLEGIEFRNEVLNVSLKENAINSMDAVTQSIPFLTVSWKAPSSTVIATYTTMEEAREKARILDRVIFNGHLIRAQMNEPPRGVALRHFVNSSVKIRGLPPNSSFGTDFVALTGTQNHRCLNSTSYDLEDSFTTIREILSQAQGVRMDTYEKLEDGLGLEGDAKIKVQFEDWGDAKKAQESVEQIRRLNSPTYKAWCPPTPVRYTIRIPRQQYEAQRKQWDALSEKKQGVDAHVLQKIGDRGDIVFIQVMGQDKKAVGILKVRVESLVAGEKLNSTYWHSSFASSQSRGFFNHVYSQKKVFVWSDFKTRSLRVFGDQQMVVDARQMIKDEVDSLAKREVTRTIDPGQIGFFMREGLDKLKELLGEENVRLNLAARPWTITVKGGEEATHHLQRLIEEARAALTLGSILPGQIIEKDICPVCYDDASNPEQLGCGHTYCSGCLKHFLSSAVDGKTFPLVCAGNEATCNVPISIPLIQRFLPAQAFRALVESAFSVHLEQHGQEFKYCTTPDCKQIYRRRTDQVTLQCPSCFSTICSACDEEAHEDMACEERRVLNSPEEQERLNEQLATQSGYKKCPQCKIWIEKTEGCNHMTCKCGAHICWRCMGIFTETTIYGHMREAHGNIYDNVPEGVQMGNMAHNAFLANQVDELARIERLRAAERERQEAAARTAAQLNRQRIENQRQRDEQAAAEQRRRREREEAEVEVRRRVDALRPAQQRVWDERQTEEEQLRRRLAELNERWDGDAQGAAQQLQEIRGRQQQQQNRNGCIVM